jgi:Zn-finger nucleic acid-binding protein
MDLTCPKCHGTMRTYERNGVHVDQCSECRGIFLDRGELDRLIDAENAWHGGPTQQEERRPEERRPEESRREPESSHGYSSGRQQAASGAGLGAVVGEVLRQVQGSKSHSSHSSDPYYRKKKKESFLGDLFG